MTRRYILLLGSWLCMISLVGCKNPQSAQKTGTSVETDADGRTRMVTNVSPEEYERMTPQERQRLNAQVGAEVSGQLWGKPRSSARDVPLSELDKAMDNAKSDSGK